MAMPGFDRKKQSFNVPSIVKIPFSPPQTNEQKSEKFLFSSFEQAFMIRRLSKYCYYDTVIVDFHQQYEAFISSYEKYLENDQQLMQLQHHKGHPVFNKDKRYFTPSFVLGIDMLDYIPYSQQDYQKFQARLEQAQKKIDERNQKKIPQLLVPKPTGNKCQICKQQYEDYLEHTKSQKHLKLFRKSKGWKYVNEFIEQFQKRQRPAFKQNNKQKIKQKPKLKAILSDQNIEKNDGENGSKKKYKAKKIIKTIPRQSISKKSAKIQKNAVLASATHSTVSPVQI